MTAESNRRLPPRPTLDSDEVHKTASIRRRGLSQSLLFPRPCDNEKTR